jgi:hypothetical protein
VLATVGVFKAEQLSRPGSDCGVVVVLALGSIPRPTWPCPRSSKLEPRPFRLWPRPERPLRWSLETASLAETGTESADEREFDNDTGELRFWEISEVSAVGLRDPGKEIGALPRFSHAAGVADAPHGWFAPTVTNRRKSAH